MVSGRIGLGSERLICRLDGEERERERKSRKREETTKSGQLLTPLPKTIIF